MQQALAMLGYENAYHFSSMYGNVKDADAWMEAHRAKCKGSGKDFGPAEWDKLLGHVAAVTDALCNICRPHPIEAYPGGMVVLLSRTLRLGM
jgi:hypothetical protein